MCALAGKGFFNHEWSHSFVRKKIHVVLARRTQKYTQKFWSALYVLGSFLVIMLLVGCHAAFGNKPFGPRDCIVVGVHRCVGCLCVGPDARWRPLRFSFAHHNAAKFVSPPRAELPFWGPCANAKNGGRIFCQVVEYVGHHKSLGTDISCTLMLRQESQKSCVLMDG